MKIFESLIPSSDYRVKSVLKSIKTKPVITQNRDDLAVLNSVLNDENLGKHIPVINNDYYLPSVDTTKKFSYQGGYFLDSTAELNSLIDSKFIIQKNRKIKPYITVNGAYNITNMIGYTQDLNLNSIFMNSFVQTISQKNSDIFGPVARRLITNDDGETFIQENKYLSATATEINDNGTFFQTTKEMFYIDEDFWTTVDGNIQKYGYACNWVNGANIGRDNSKGLFKGDDLKVAWERLLSIAKSKRNSCFLYYDGVYYRYRSSDDGEKYFYNEKDDVKSDFFLPTNEFQRDNAIMLIESEDPNEPPEVVLYSLSESEATATAITEELYFYEYNGGDVEQDDYEQSYYPKKDSTPKDIYKLFSISIDEELDDDQCLSKINFKDGTYFFKRVNLGNSELKLYNMGFESLDFVNGLILTEAYKKDISELLKPFYIDGDETKQNYILKKIEGSSEYQIYKIYLKDTDESFLLKRELNGSLYSYNKEHNAYFIKDRENIKNIAKNISDIIRNLPLENVKTTYGNLYYFLKKHTNTGIFVNKQIKNNINGYENQDEKNNELSGYWKIKSFREIESLNKYDIINSNKIYTSFLSLESNPAFKLFNNNGKYNFIRIRELVKNTLLPQNDFFEPVSLSFSNNLTKKYLIDSNTYFYNETLISSDPDPENSRVKYFYKIDYVDNKIDIIYIPNKNGRVHKLNEIEILIKDRYLGYKEYLYKLEIKNRKGFFTNNDVASYKSFSVQLDSNLKAGRVLEENKEIICDGKNYILITFPTSNGNKKFLVEKLSLAESDYIKIDGDNLFYNAAYNNFSKEMSDGEKYQIFKSITSENELSIFNYEKGPQQIPETYKYSRKIHAFYNDEFLKVYERPLSSYLIYPNIAFRSRLNTIKNDSYFESLGNIEENYIENISSKIYFNNSFDTDSDKNKENYILEKNFIDQKNFPIIYRMFNTSYPENYQNNVIKNISEILYKQQESDFSDVRPPISNGSWCAFNSLSSQIFNNDNRDKIIQSALNGDLNFLTLNDIEKYLEMFSKEVVSFIEKKKLILSEEKLSDLKIAMSDLELSFNEFQQLFNEVSGDFNFSEYFVNVSDIFKKIWDYSSNTIDNFDIDFSKESNEYYDIYETYRFLMNKINNIDVRSIDNIETVKIMEFFYLLSIFFEENNKIINITVNPDEEESTNSKISSIKLIIFMNEDSEETNNGTAQITFVSKGNKISYSLPVTNFSGSDSARAACWKNKKDNPDIQIEVGDNNDILITEKLSSRLNNENIEKEFSGTSEENLSAIVTKENLKIFYNDCRRFRYQYAFMIYQLNTNKKINLSKYQYENYTLCD